MSNNANATVIRIMNDDIKDLKLELYNLQFLVATKKDVIAQKAYVKNLIKELEAEVSELELN